MFILSVTWIQGEKEELLEPFLCIETFIQLPSQELLAFLLISPLKPEAGCGSLGIYTTSFLRSPMWKACLSWCVERNWCIGDALLSVGAVTCKVGPHLHHFIGRNSCV